MLERIFAERQPATAAAFAALRAWPSEGVGSLAAAMEQAVDDYLAFLIARPEFVRLVEREDLSDGRHLRVATRDSQAMT